MHDVARIDNVLTIRREKKYVDVVNKKRIKKSMERLDSGAYTRMQFLRAVSHSMGQDATALQAQLPAGFDSSDDDDNDAVDEDNKSQQSVDINNPVADDSDDEDFDRLCVVCLVAQRSPTMAFVPCYHSRFSGRVRTA